MPINNEYFDRCSVGLAHQRLESFRPGRKLAPGDIASCKGSVEVAMYQVLAQHGFHLKSWQKTDGIDMPYRYCIINRHLGDQKYEVFLLTTFGNARTAHGLSMIGKAFGMPMGNTGWINDTKPLQTYPIFLNLGLMRKSFVFAIPFIATIEENDTARRLPIPGRVHLLYSDLHRLQAFSTSKIPFLLSNHWMILRDLYAHKQCSASTPNPKDTPTDAFSPTTFAFFESSVEDLTESSQEWESRTMHHSRAVAPRRLAKRLRVDFRWLSRFAETDIRTSSTFLRNRCLQPPVKKALPPPYYATCLRTRLKTISRIIR